MSRRRKRHRSAAHFFDRGGASIRLGGDEAGVCVVCGLGLAADALAIVGAQLGTPPLDRPEVGRWIASALVELTQLGIEGFVWIRLALSLRDGVRPSIRRKSR
jgi:hypothetical protein